MDRRRELQQEKIHAGSQAGLIISVVAPYISNTISDYVQQLAGLYRGASYTHDQIVGKVAEITALLNLLAHLESQERQGDHAASKEYGNGS